MSLADPTGGIGYPFGGPLPSAHAASLAAQIAQALDKSGGDTISGDVALVTGAKFRRRVGLVSSYPHEIPADDDDIVVFLGTGTVSVSLPANDSANDGMVKRLINPVSSRIVSVTDGIGTVVRFTDRGVAEVYYSSGRAGWFVSSYAGSVDSLSL